ELRPEQAHDVRKDREAKAGKHFIAERGAADAVAPIEYQHLLARAREIRRAREAVVPAADPDHVMLRHARFLGGSKNGFLTTGTPARLRLWSTVIFHLSGSPALAFVLHRDLHLERRAELCPLRTQMREGDVLFQHGRPGAAGGVAALLAARINWHAPATRTPVATRVK